MKTRPVQAEMEDHAVHLSSRGVVNKLETAPCALARLVAKRFRASGMPGGGLGQLWSTALETGLLPRNFSRYCHGKVNFKSRSSSADFSKWSVFGLF